MSRPQPPDGGTTSFLQYTGVPKTWLKRPNFKLPSRNWLIFISTTVSIAALYAYDRRRCKQIREEYIGKVKYLSEEPLERLSFLRKVTIFGCKWPGDEDADRSLKHFRKYVKPILVAAAVDYEMVNGKRHGSLADLIAEKIKERRRLELGIDPPPRAEIMGIPGHTPDERRKRELEGGIVIIGRHTFKEFMNGLKRGWSEPLYKVDKEDDLARELELDGVFDEPEVEGQSPALSDDPASTNSHTSLNLMESAPLSVFPRTAQNPTSLSQKMETTTEDPILTTPPSTIPTYPPILLVSFTNLIGFKLIPRMIWEFFNQRERVREGAKLAYELITGTPRPIHGPSYTSEDRPGEVETSLSSDLSFDLQSEEYYRSTDLPAEIEKARKSYYEALRPKIVTARELAHGEREPTKEERNYPPPTEVELRTERMNKEIRWRSDLAGWEIINPATPVSWDPRFAGALWVYPAVNEDTLQSPQDSYTQ